MIAALMWLKIQRFVKTGKA